MWQPSAAWSQASPGEWLFLEDPAGRARVMPIASMCRVAGNGVILELV